ncbi:MAG TPA: DUF2029 domain-containing protein [Candidatus Corynebacterium avicola]|uniref:DUF2029 domain-containing protein n=1 Tax=Candidatus Corynebacterium avicola TaxID=2838527 RepID=A0A9D1RQZ3_9CORY|nr:DUF2029 domain-containing protein [Candidatus Corynebacterium avicola]
MVILGGVLAHVIPVYWILHDGEALGDVRYYRWGLTGQMDGAMTEYPEVGTWPAKLAQAFTGSEVSDAAESRFIIGFIALNILTSAAFAALLWWRGRARGAATAVWFWLLFIAVSGPIGVTRLDLFPGLLVAGAVWLLFTSARARNLAPVLLAAATMMKLWPGTLGAMLVGGWRRRSTWVRVAVFVASLAALCLLVVVTGSVDRLTSPLTYQGDRGLQIESIAATPVMLAAAVAGYLNPSAQSSWEIGYAASKSYEITGPGVGTAVTVATVAQVVVIVAALAWAVTRLLRDDWTPTFALASILLLTVLVIATNKVFSPQYTVWVAPAAAVGLLVVTGDARRWIRAVAGLVLVIAGLTAAVYPGAYEGLVTAAPDLDATVVLTLRSIAFIVLAVVCAGWTFSSSGRAARGTATG